MTKDLSPIAALHLVPGWDVAGSEITVLSGGLTNRSFRVRHRSRDYVLRLDSDQSQLFQLNRPLEREIMQRACVAGIAPRIVHADDENGFLLREHLEGRVWTHTAMSQTGNLERLAGLLRRVHALPLSGHPLDLAGIANTYVGHLNGEADSYSFALRCAAIIQDVPAAGDLVCGHNDIVAGNVIEQNQLMLIDWEYAADSDRMYDLASAIAYHNLSADLADVLLQAYVGSVSMEWRERLAQQQRAYDAIHWLWLATRQLVAPAAWQVERLGELRQRIH